MKTLKYPIDIAKNRRVDYGDVVFEDVLFSILPLNNGKIFELTSETKAQIGLWYRESNEAYTFDGVIEKQTINFVFEKAWIASWDKVDATIKLIDGDVSTLIGTISFIISQEEYKDSVDEVLDDALDGGIDIDNIKLPQSRTDSVKAELIKVVEDVFKGKYKHDLVFEFPTPKAEWYIYHKQDRYFNVLALDENHELLIGDVRYHGTNALTVFFNKEVSGTAILN